LISEIPASPVVMYSTASATQPGRWQQLPGLTTPEVWDDIIPFSGVRTVGRDFATMACILAER
jgi:hypothetical protein